MHDPLQPDVDEVVKRFVQDIQECVEAVNRALPHFGKTLTTLSVNSQHGKIDVEIGDDITVIH